MGSTCSTSNIDAVFQYTRGVEAYKSGFPANCRHVRQGLRVYWYTGYYDFQTKDRLAKIFDKYKVSYP